VNPTWMTPRERRRLRRERRFWHFTRWLCWLGLFYVIAYFFTCAADISVAEALSWVTAVSFTFHLGYMDDAID